MVRNVTIIKAQMKQLQESMDVLLVAGNHSTALKPSAASLTLPKLPIEDVAALTDMALQLGKKDLRELMVCF